MFFEPEPLLCGGDDDTPATATATATAHSDVCAWTALLPETPTLMDASISVDPHVPLGAWDDAWLAQPATSPVSAGGAADDENDAPRSTRRKRARHMLPPMDGGDQLVACSVVDAAVPCVVAHVVPAESTCSSGHTSSAGSGSDGDLTEAERMQLKRERNRIHARQSRKRKKQYVGDLERRVAEMEEARIRLEESNRDLRTQNELLHQQLGFFQRLLTPYMKGAQAAAGSVGTAAAHVAASAMAAPPTPTPFPAHFYSKGAASAQREGANKAAVKTSLLLAMVFSVALLVDPTTLGGGVATQAYGMDGMAATVGVQHAGRVLLSTHAADALPRGHAHAGTWAPWLWTLSLWAVLLAVAGVALATLAAPTAGPHARAHAPLWRTWRTWWGQRMGHARPTSKRE